QIDKFGVLLHNFDPRAIVYHSQTENWEILKKNKNSKITMDQFIKSQIEKSKTDYEIRIFEECIVYRGIKLNYQISEDSPKEEIRTANVLVDGASHQFNLESRTFNLDFINFLGTLPPIYLRSFN
ncbi:hypothetical protein ISS08_01565, partial [Candidatus Pacearchaeota archaeon]|nr:hypothetical protein [Candidatus Pacearchaeota archaeon]